MAPPPPSDAPAGLTRRKKASAAGATAPTPTPTPTGTTTANADGDDAPLAPRRRPWPAQHRAPPPLPLFLPLLFPALLAATSAISAAVVSKHVPAPYMDEAFHVPQTRRLCERGLSGGGLSGGAGGGWDPKITTPAGLYLLGVAYASLQAGLVRAVGGGPGGPGGWPALRAALCGEPAALRGLNCALLALCLLPAFAVRAGALAVQRQRGRRRRRPRGGRRGKGPTGAEQAGGPADAAAGGGEASEEEEEEERERDDDRDRDRDDARDALGTALAAGVLLPTHFFFGFLYYTDVGALLFLLLAAAALQRWAAAACAAAAAPAPPAGRQGGGGGSASGGVGGCRASALLAFAAAVAGAASVAMRQTNAVWYAFLVGAALLRVAFTTLGREAAGRRRRPPAPSSSPRPASAPAPPVAIRALAALVRHERAAGPALAAAQLALLLLPVAAFVAFVVLANGGRVALGDHDAHGALGSTRHWLHPWLAGGFAALGAGAPFFARPGALRRLAGRFRAAGPGRRAGGERGGESVGGLEGADAAGRRAGGKGRGEDGGGKGGKGGGGGGRANGARVAVSARAVAAAAAVLAAALASARFGTVAHPYLLADNRHYAFYAWRRTLGRHWAAKYALAAPLGAAAWLLLASELAAGASGGGGGGGEGEDEAEERQEGEGEAEGALWVLGFAAACVVTLVPAGLIEPRYYTAPAVLAMLHAPARLTRGPAAAAAAEDDGRDDAPAPTAAPPSRGCGFDWSALVACVAYAAVNAVTLYVFAYRPFAWPDGSTARFMW